MKSFNLYKTKLNQRDIEKGQKIIAAIYLVTNHLSDNDPIRHELRAQSISFVTAPTFESNSLLSRIEMSLGAAVLSGLISEKNASIIIYEAKHFTENLKHDEAAGYLDDFFGDHLTLQTNHHKEQGVLKDTKKTKEYTPLKLSNIYVSNNQNKKTLESKSTRQDKILSFINDKKSAVIKDITTLFPEVSEKTIQRELNVLIDTGRIIKRGSKRWSIYMAVNSLL